MVGCRHVVDRELAKRSFPHSCSSSAGGDGLAIFRKWWYAEGHAKPVIACNAFRPGDATPEVSSLLHLDDVAVIVLCFFDDFKKTLLCQQRHIDGGGFDAIATSAR